MAEVRLLIVTTESLEVPELLSEALESALVDLYEIAGMDEIESEVFVRYQKAIGESRVLTGVSVRLPALGPGLNHAIANMVSILRTDPDVKHVVKLADEAQLTLAHHYLEEIYYLEMLLREALTLIFLDTLAADYYQLLTESDVVFPNGRHPDTSLMEERAENEFFYLLFGDYRKVTARRRVSNVGQLLRLIDVAETFEAIKSSVTPRIQMSEHYEDFLASIQANLDPIESVRNCVMHNRSVSETQHQNYERAKHVLFAQLEGFLGGL